jgi:hypothetical protein
MERERGKKDGWRDTKWMDGSIDRWLNRELNTMIDR